MPRHWDGFHGCLPPVGNWLLDADQQRETEPGDGSVVGGGHNLVMHGKCLVPSVFCCGAILGLRWHGAVGG